MSLTRRALWTIERNLGAELSLGRVAEALSVSRWHLAHAFGASTGLPLMTYVRRRRLSEAAAALAAGAPDILQVALAAGYGSHEAFSRAFRQDLGRTPEQVRADASLRFVRLTPALDLPKGEAGGLLTPREQRLGALRVVGLRETRTFDAAQDIPGQWRRFMAHYEEIEGKADPVPLGVASDVDDEGRFAYMCAVEVRGPVGTPRGLEQLTIPAQRYLVFRHDGNVATLGNSYRTIWDSWLDAHGRRAADGPSLERYSPAFDTRTGEGGVELWIPVEPAARPPAP